MTTTVRSRAIAAQDAAIESNIATIQEAKRSPSAIDVLAQNLSVSPGRLVQTLKNTVFKGASDDEFTALVIVSNAYRLNPMLKEIYAFPAKGGGIIPYVSVDGWTRIVNEHPAFDGLEFNDIVDERGNLYAIESVIYRRDRTRPIKVTEYMDECKGQGPAWQKTPKRMLRHRALIQGARIAFGFSGIYADGDEPIEFTPRDGGDLARQVPPSRTQIAHNPDTGEIIDDNTLAELDRNSFAEMDRDLGHASSSSSSTPDDRSEDHQPSGEREGPDDSQRGEVHNTSGAEEAAVAGLLKIIARQASPVDLNSLMAKRRQSIAEFSEENRDRVNEAAMARMAELKG